MSNYPLLSFYRIFLILTIVGVIGYALFAPNNLSDGGAITFDEYIEAYVPPALVIVGLLAMIQLIGAVFEISNRHHADYQMLVDKNKVLSEQIKRLEKSNDELKKQVQRTEAPINAVGRRLD